MAEGAAAVGVGPTEELCLRVSAAALARVIFAHPRTCETMLVLERLVTTAPGLGGAVSVKALPFGGGVRLLRPAALLEHIHAFHYDSPRSQEEGDFRILIRPQDWPAARAFCLRHFLRPGPVLEASPARELAEEFTTALGTPLEPGQYDLAHVCVLAEDHALPSASPRAGGLPTVRIYNLFEARLRDPALFERIVAESETGGAELIQRANEDARRGGKGRAHSLLALPLAQLTQACLALPPEHRGQPLLLDGHHLDSPVFALLEGVENPRYARIG